MMRKKVFVIKTILILLTFSVVSLLGATVSSALNSGYVTATSKTFSEPVGYSDQTEAIKLWYKIERYVRQDVDGVRHYHPDYGGAYVTLDGGITILILQGGDNLKEELSEIVGNTVPAAFMTCLWSREDAQHAIESLAVIKDKADCIAFEVMREAVVVDVSGDCADEVEQLVNSLEWNTDPSRPPLIVVDRH